MVLAITEAGGLCRSFETEIAMTVEVRNKRVLWQWCCVFGRVALR